MKVTKKQLLEENRKLKNRVIFYIRHVSQLRQKLVYLEKSRVNQREQYIHPDDDFH